jgi:hypothetical protein
MKLKAILAISLGLCLWGWCSVASAMYYIWMFHEGDYVQFNVPMGADVEIKVWAGNCGKGSFDFYEGSTKYTKEIPKGGSISLPLSGGAYRFVNREGKPGYSSNSDINVQIPDNAKNIKYKHIEPAKNLCGSQVSKTANIP